jgi:hypothetical protein
MATGRSREQPHTALDRTTLHIPSAVTEAVDPGERDLPVPIRAGLERRPPVEDVRMLDFLAAEEVLAAAEATKEEVKRRLGRLIEAW